LRTVDGKNGSVAVRPNTSGELARERVEDRHVALGGVALAVLLALDVVPATPDMDHLGGQVHV
jgi:hypothetical protein